MEMAEQMSNVADVEQIHPQWKILTQAFPWANKMCQNGHPL